MFPAVTETLAAHGVVVHFYGDLDIGTRPEVAAACRRVGSYDSRLRVHLDLSGVDFVDCRSLRIIADAVRLRHALGDPTTVVAPSPFLRSLFELTGYLDPHDLVPRLLDAA